MEDLLKKQIKDSCKLALPDGLEELMSDISREVLRTQPTDLYQFIADYLSALLVTRENIHVAARVCADICQNSMHVGLGEDLIDVGLNSSQVIKVMTVVKEYFQNEQDPENNLLSQLLSETDIEESYLVEVENAIQKSFKRHLATKTTIYEADSDSELSEATLAAQHTLDLYRQTNPSENEVEKAVQTIQAAYRAYGVRYYRRSKEQQNRPSLPEYKPQFLPEIRNQSLPEDIAQGKPSKSIRFGSDEDMYSRSTNTLSSSTQLSDYTEKTDDIFVSASVNRTLQTESSTSLAGSLIQLGRKPYCVHDTLQEVDEPEYMEKEHANIDYTLHHNRDSDEAYDSENIKIVFSKVEVIPIPDDESTRENAKISFDRVEVIEDYADHAYDSDASVPEELWEDHEMDYRELSDSNPEKGYDADQFSEIGDDDIHIVAGDDLAVPDKTMNEHARAMDTFTKADDSLTVITRRCSRNVTSKVAHAEEFQQQDNNQQNVHAKHLEVNSLNKTSKESHKTNTPDVKEKVIHHDSEVEAKKTDTPEGQEETINNELEVSVPRVPNQSLTSDNSEEEGSIRS